MKLLEKTDGHVIFVKRVLFVFLAVHFGLWVFFEKIAFSSEEKPVSLAVIDSIEGIIEIKTEDLNHRTEAKEGISLYQNDVIIIHSQSQVSLSHQLKNEPKQIFVEKGEYRLLFSGDTTFKSHDLPENHILGVHIKQEGFAYRFIPDPPQSDTLKTFLKDTQNTIVSALFVQPKSFKPWRKGAQAKIADLITPPVGTTIMARYPYFVWSSLPDVKDYDILIFDGLGEIVWTYKIPATASKTQRYTYPKDAPSLKSGEYYFWQVNVGADEGSPNLRKNLYGTLGTAYFTVMDKEDIEEVHKTVEEARQVFDTTQSGNFGLFLGSYYESRHLYGDAQKEYEKLMTSDSTNDLYKNMLANVYMKVGRKWAAAELLQD